MHTLISLLYIDIDDTIRNSHVLNKLQLLKSTFGEPPYPVPGMPELYTSLSRSLKAPLFVYISGSPFQLYPFLQGFLGSTFPASKGPIFLRNFTASSAASLMNMAKTGNIKEHKLAMIDRIHGMYPEKQFLAIGDSGELDPETYGESCVPRVSPPGYLYSGTDTALGSLDLDIDSTTQKAGLSFTAYGSVGSTVRRTPKIGLQRRSKAFPRVNGGCFQTPRFSVFSLLLMWLEAPVDAH